MMNHPWMKLELEKNKSLGAKDKLEKYMSVRKDLSYREKGNKNG